VDKETPDNEGLTHKGVTGSKAGPKTGVKSPRWDQDHDILLRLETVAIMVLQGASLRQIAEAMGYSHETARKDRERVRLLWRREAVDQVVEARNQSIAQIRLVQSEAWAVWRDMSREERKHMPAPLKTVLDAERQIIELQGSGLPAEHDVTIHVKDIEAVRKQRWEQIGGALKEALSEDPGGVDD